MAKKTGDDPKYKAFKKSDKGGRATPTKSLVGLKKSDPAYGGVGPRVGSDRKRGTVKVSKPSGVSSGWVPAKKSSAKKKR